MPRIDEQREPPTQVGVAKAAASELAPDAAPASPLYPAATGDHARRPFVFFREHGSGVPTAYRPNAGLRPFPRSMDFLVRGLPVHAAGATCYVERTTQQELRIT